MLLQFDDKELFVSEYQRNNKAKGRKNLRCFPACRKHGHVDTGYCGRPVKAKLSYDPASLTGLDIVAFCEFRPVNHKIGECVETGQIYRYEDILRFSRGGEGTGQNAEEKALNPWFPGQVIDTQIKKENSVVSTFAFNQSNQGWHYAWQSHRMTRDTTHCLHVFILAGSKINGIFTVVSEALSPAFQIYCRRKRCDSRSKGSDGVVCCSEVSGKSKRKRSAIPLLSTRTLPAVHAYSLPYITTPPRTEELCYSSPHEPRCPSPTFKRIKEETNSARAFNQHGGYPDMQILSPFSNGKPPAMLPDPSPANDHTVKNDFRLQDVSNMLQPVACTKEASTRDAQSNNEFTALCALASLAQTH